MTPEDFDAARREGGYGPAKEVSFAPSSRSAEHVHDRESFVYVLAGTFILNTPDGPVTRGAGETCLLPADVEHAEEAGPDGATILVARR